MDDLHAWLSQQHHGLRTFRTFQHKLEMLGRHDPAQSGLCRLLGGIVGSYIEAFDEAPLSVDIAEIACRRRSKASICTETPRAASPTSTVWRPASCAGDRQDEFAQFNFAIMRRAATASRRMTPEL